MSRQIDFSRKLSKADKIYLRSRNLGHLIDNPPVPETEPEDDEDVPYPEWTVEELKQEINDRNKTLDDDLKMSTSGNKGELIARLEQNDVQSQ